MKKIFGWIKQNKLAAILLLLILWLVYQNYRPRLYGSSLLERQNTDILMKSLPASEGIGGESISFSPGSPPAPEVTERLVIKETSLSLLVKKVAETQKEIIKKAEEIGGYLVNSYLTHPEEAQVASGSVTVRIPQNRLVEALDYFRSLAVKVVSENLSGRDVTDEYVDIEARLATLLKTKTKFEEIMGKAEKVEEILQVQRELVNLQEQIDALKGQQQYLEKNAQMSRVTFYLATDELALPYAPTQVWRPSVIFKRAVRSLVGSFRQAGTALIWLGVYAVIWLPVLVIYLIFRRRKKVTS